MARKRYRYPITSHMVLQSVHDIAVRAAENKAESGGTSRRIKRSILVETATVTEQGARWMLETFE